jgi:ABC-type multidrug transport system ATPase subunit
MGLLGPSGAGKSTIFKMLTMMTPRDTGSITVAGIDFNKYFRDYSLMT